MLQLSKVKIRFEGDTAIWVIFLIMSVFSLWIIYSSTGDIAFDKLDGDTGYFLRRRFKFLFFSWVLAYIVHKIPVKYIKIIAVFGLLISIPLLSFNLFIGSRWVRIPLIGLSIQFSEIAKYALLVTTAWLITHFRHRLHETKYFLIILSPVILITGLIILGDGSTAALIFISCVVLIYMGRAKLTHLAYLLGILAVSMVIGYQIISAFPDFYRFGTWKNRIDNYMNKDVLEDFDDNHFQISRSKFAIASGGLRGKGPGKSTIRYILPEAHNDFIYAIIIEEYGSILGAILLSFYIMLLYRSIRIFYKSKKQFNGLVVLGIGFTISIQAMVNMAVSTDAMFVTGQTLPAISQGGTSVFMTFIGIGIIQAVTSQQEEPEETIEDGAIEEA